MNYYIPAHPLGTEALISNQDYLVAVDIFLLSSQPLSDGFSL